MDLYFLEFLLTTFLVLLLSINSQENVSLLVISISEFCSLSIITHVNKDTRLSSLFSHFYLSSIPFQMGLDRTDFSSLTIFINIEYEQNQHNDQIRLTDGKNNSSFLSSLTVVSLLLMRNLLVDRK